MMQYRKEIDGLRALAVVPVILFHAGFSAFSGGFVGVDVFFVISGYLITCMVTNDLTRGNFSLRRFYARRARRILPALLAVMLACVPFAFLWMLPSQYADFSRSLIAVVFFISNIFFWHESGYFAAEASEKPLLHTWSLGVEEQFYVLFPLMVMVIWRFGRKYVRHALAVSALLSFLVCEYASRYSPSADFFLLPTRAWELLVGSLCALISVQHIAAKNRNLLAALGFGLLIGSVIVLDEHMRLPSLYSLMPVGGAALVLLYATTDTWVARLLSLRPFVAVGLVSYSAYLWHHPLFAFARLRIFTTPETSTMLLLAALSLGLAALTWRYVEQPFRNAKHQRYVTNKQALIYAGLAALLLITVGVHGHFSQGRLAYWNGHAAENQVRAFELLEATQDEPRFYDNADCIFNINQLTTKVQERIISCHKKYGSGVAVIGDSHAINLFYALKERAGKRSFVIGISQGMCRPHANRPDCYYDTLVTFVERNPQLFHDIIYEQAGFHLLQDMRGNDIERGNISGLLLDAMLPDFQPNQQSIVAVKAYLLKLAPFARVTWFGPRIEPEIRESVIVHLGCDYPFRLRPNQAETFMRLEGTIENTLKDSPILYRSQIALMQFDMAKDFISCDKTYFIDGDHYSHAGEQRFSERITFGAVLNERPKP